MGFNDNKFSRSCKSTIFVVASASDCAEYSKPSGREYICTSGCSLAGLLGNLCLASYFIKKRETEATVVQTLGVISTYVVMLQLAMVKVMPLPQFIVTSVVVACGLIINFTQYFNLLHPSIWSFWGDFMTIAGVSTLLQLKYQFMVCCIGGTGAL
ncbi:hypothetical protein ACS0TY_004195 [Phlomoides rotata]